MKTLRVCCVIGARPNFIKAASLLDALQHRGNKPILIHTGQHFSPEMSDSFFRELSMPAPDLNLCVGPGSQIKQTADIMCRLEPAFLEVKPDVVLVVGDVNSTLAAALVASKLGTPIAHVEAGLRSFDRRMPEELNRIVTDALSDFLFVTEPSGRANLLAEGTAPEKIFFVGNVMIDTLFRFREQASRSEILNSLGVAPRAYALVTLHRPSNVDVPEQLAPLLTMIEAMSEHIPVVFPVHPRTRAKINSRALAGRIIVVPPLGYIDFLQLMSEARLVLTDSGGIQEETTILQTPCLTLRDNTERPVTIHQGTNQLVGTNPDAILKTALNILSTPPDSLGQRVPELWDGQASGRILDILEARL